MALGLTLNGRDEGDALIGKLVQRYAGISTYRDRGVVPQVLREGEEHRIKTNFETRFRRPGVSVAEEVPMGQFEYYFCGTKCLRKFLNHCVDVLEQRLRKYAN